MPGDLEKARAADMVKTTADLIANTYIRETELAYIRHTIVALACALIDAESREASDKLIWQLKKVVKSMRKFESARPSDGGRMTEDSIGGDQ
jgi:hypothetical protein